jgi:hypothetical protein
VQADDESHRRPARLGRCRTGKWCHAAAPGYEVLRMLAGRSPLSASDQGAGVLVYPTAVYALRVDAAALVQRMTRASSAVRPCMTGMSPSERSSPPLAAGRCRSSTPAAACSRSMPRCARQWVSSTSRTSARRRSRCGCRGLPQRPLSATTSTASARDRRSTPCAATQWRGGRRPHRLRYADDHVFLIPNAANTAEVVRRLREEAPDGITITNEHEAYAVLAVQGPRSTSVWPPSTCPLSTRT